MGDNVPSISNAQTLTNIYGKILRFNLDGTTPTDNPFVNVPGAVPQIYAYGLRNPFRFTFLPNGKPMTEDTGSSYWEELNTIQPGGNYGWDFYEGNCGSCGYINPVYAYGHLPTDGAASAITAYSGSAFPKQYDNAVFFGDYNRHDIEAVTFDPTYSTETSDTVFDSGAGTVADLREGPDGALYYVSIFEGTFSKLYPVGPFPPVAAASASPNAGLAPATVQFSSGASSDPYGGPLTFSWNFGDGSPVSTAANPSHTYSTNGTYAATLTVSNGAQSSNASTQVIVGRSPPSASITSPAANATYSGGDTISFAGTANDAVDGPLPATAFTWQVDFYSNGVVQPFYTYEVPHPFAGPLTGVASGTFQIPQDLSNTASTFYRVTLTVTDSSGIETAVTRDIHPNLTNWSVNTNIPGAAYVVDGSRQTSPYATQDAVGIQHALSGVPTQTIGPNRYRMHGWSDGSALTDLFTNTSASGSYTANYDQVQGTLPSPWQSLDVGSPLMTGAADYAANDQTFYIDGSGSDVIGTKDQFHYVDQPLNGDGTIIARVRYQTNSNPWAKAGVMIKQSPTAGSTFVDALTTPDVSPNTPNVNGVGCNANGCASPLPPVTPPVGNGVRMQYTSTGSIKPSTTLTGYNSPNEWLKLQRAGNSFTSWYSTDGNSWTEIGTKNLTMNAGATIGLFVTSHNVGQYSTVAFDNVQVVQAPVTSVTKVSPNTGSTAGGTSVTITGTNLTGATGVNFGATAATNFVVNSPTSITATSPAEAAGTVDVRVTTPGGTSATSSADQFSYLGQSSTPTVTGVSPNSGSTAGGTSVTITGTNLTGATGVNFGATAATNFVVNSPTSITATSPAEAAGTVDVRVTTPGGTSATSSADQYNYATPPPTPTVTGVSPNTGSTAGGTSVTITGTNLTGATGVNFGATAATNFVVNSPTSITATSPAEAAGTVDVRVTTPGGTSATSSADQFSYLGQSSTPTVTGVSPNSGSTAGGTSVTITGTNLTGATGVNFGATAATNFVVNSPTSITATSPAEAAGTVDVRVTTPGGTSATSSADQFGYLASSLPAPWIDTDVGSPSIGGSASYANGVYTVNGAGTDIWGTNDQFNYVYQPLNGNGTLIARVTSQTNTSANAKAGIMFKQSTTAGSPYILIAVAPGGGIKVQYLFNGSVGGGTYPAPNTWMKLTRAGTRFTAYVSADGVTWTQVVSKTLAISTNATAGFYVCSHKATALGTATFDNASFAPGP